MRYKKWKQFQKGQALLSREMQECIITLMQLCSTVLYISKQSNL